MRSFTLENFHHSLCCVGNYESNQFCNAVIGIYDDAYISGIKKKTRVLPQLKAIQKYIRFIVILPLGNILEM